MKRILIGLIGLALLGACDEPEYIPMTKIPDSPLNRDLLKTMEKYRQAVEQKDAASVLVLAHPTYRDENGSPDPSDDIDYDELKKLLNTRFQNTNRVRIRVEYHGVKTSMGVAQIDTWVDATFVYAQPDLTERWHRFTDYNRFELINDGQMWRFISGL